MSVSLPAVLTSPDPATVIHCEGTTVVDALRAATAQAPRFGSRIFYGDRLLVTVTLNGRLVAPAAAATTPVSAGDRLELQSPVAGG